MATRIVIVGGGFGGANVARYLERYLPTGAAEVTLVSRDNFYLMTPLLFEVGSGVLELRHAVNPIRPLLKTTKFVNATVTSIDLAGKTVHTKTASGDEHPLPYNHLVLALGQVTDTARIPGSEHAMPFKTVVDAILFQSQVIEQFERAAIERDLEKRRRSLTFVVVGGGLVGVELVGEMTEFAGRLLKTYTGIKREEVRIELVQNGPRILPELSDSLARYAADQFTGRGVRIRTETKVERIEPGRVHLGAGEVIETATIMLAAGLAPNPVVAALDLPNVKGRVKADACMRVEGALGAWAVGDCAAVPGPDGKPYPTLAQHAIRAAKQLARNIAATVAGKEPQPFVYHTLGTMAALGHNRGVAKLLGVRVKGFFAWVIWRSYYLLQMAGLERKLRVAIDWSVGLFFSPDAVKVDVDEAVGRMRRVVQPAADDEYASGEARSPRVSLGSAELVGANRDGGS
jgi:NADH dehydrogenase